MTTVSEGGIDLTFSEEELEAIREHIVSFIQDRTAAAGVNRAVLGLSGGIDSTLTAYLAVEALGEEGLHGLVMPSRVDLEKNMSDAERVARELGIEYDVIEIEPIVEAFLEVFPGDTTEDRLESDPLRTAVGNVRVRSRAVMNYFIANDEHALVLGTGNRTEALVGYFTKYGDGAVDCHPIGRLYKGQVRQLARHMGVPDDIVTKTPTAGLWAGQTDEDELGMTYETLDAILALAVDGAVPPRATATLVDLPIEEVHRIRDLHRASQHKRQLPPSPTPR